MKQFTKLYSDFWVNHNNSEIIKLGADAQLMALYLQANSHHNMLGVYYLPLLYIASDLKLPIKQVQTTLNKLCQINYCEYDKETQYIWVYNLAYEQIGENIDTKDNRIKSLHAIWDSLPSKLEFLYEIYQKYVINFHLKPRIFENSLNLEQCETKELKELRKTKQVKKTKSSKKTKSKVTIPDINLNTVTDTDTNTNINTTASTSTNSSINPSQHLTLDTQVSSEEILPLFVSPFEGPLEEILETPTEGINNKEVCKSNFLNIPLDPSPEFLQDHLGIETPPTTNITCKTSSIEGGSEIHDSVLIPSKDLPTPFKAPSKPLKYPFEASSKDLRSPLVAPSETLRSNIEYRIKNIDNRNKKVEIENRRKEKTKKRDLYLNHVPSLNIVAQARQFQPSIKNSFESNSFPSLSLTSQLHPSAQPGSLKASTTTKTIEAAEIAEVSEANEIANAEHKSSNCNAYSDFPGIAIATTATKIPITAGVSLESDTVAKKPSVEEIKVADSVSFDVQDTTAVSGIPSISSIFSIPAIPTVPDVSGITSILNISDTSDDSISPISSTVAATPISPAVPIETNDPIDATSENAVEVVFGHWKKVMGHPNSRLDRKRSCLIRRALRDGYSVQQLCDAINGCSITPHNTGQNDHKQRYDGLHIILGDGDQIDRFIRNYNNPSRPKPYTKAHQRLEDNILEADGWIKEKLSKSINKTNNVNTENNSRR